MGEPLPAADDAEPAIRPAAVPSTISHSTPGGPGTETPLPPGVHRADGCPSHISVGTCRVLRVAVRAVGGGLHVVTVQEGERPAIRPAPRERLRDLRPGDCVRFLRSEAPRWVEWVEVVE